MKSLGERIEKFIMRIGSIGGFLILLLLLFISFEVIARYVFNSPTNWVWLVNKQIFGVYIVLAGGYALLSKQHIRIEVFYDHFPPLLKRIIRWFSLFFALIFLGALLWKSATMGLDAWETKERAVGVFHLPLYPLKMFMPIGTALYIVGCVIFFSRKKNE